MKEDIKKILLMGLGAMSLTNEKAKEIKDDLLKKGQELYEKGAIANEELKHNIKEVMKENVTIVPLETEVTSDDIIDTLDNLSEEERTKILEAIEKKGWSKQAKEKDEKKKEQK